MEKRQRKEGKRKETIKRKISFNLLTPWRINAFISRTDRQYECIRYCNYNICIFVTVGDTMIERIIEN